MAHPFSILPGIKGLGLLDQTQVIQIDSNTAITVHYTVTLGELLVSTLLLIFILTFLMAWAHRLIFGGR